VKAQFFIRILRVGKPRLNGHFNRPLRIAPLVCIIPRMTPTLKLNNGAELPAVGLGLWKIARDETARVVKEAIEEGYRHFDAACDYGNEAEAGQGFRAAFDAGLCRREDLWVTSKLWNTYHAAEHVRPACERSLRDLGLDYLDLYLIHFPIAQKYVPFDLRYPPEWITDPDAEQPRVELAPVPLAETWGAMEELVDAGLVRNIGVCNYGAALLRDLLNYARIAPSVLQVELHPFLTQEKLLRFCRENDIVVTGFSPLGAQSYFQLNMARAEESVLENEVVRRIAEAHGRSPAQVVQRWAVQRGTAIVPKTSRRERLRENLALFDFELSEEEMKAISGLNRNRRFNDPGDFAEAAFNTFLPIYD